MRNEPVPPPWNAFLREVDQRLREPVDLHCVGGFVVSLRYGLARPTGDIDVIAALPDHAKAGLVRLAGRGSDLHRKHGVYLQIVSVAATPDDYEQRLSEMFAGAFSRVRLFALDPYDLALTKLERNLDQDVEDIRHLARVVPFDLEVLKRRYEDELRPYLGRPDREDLTLRLWIEIIEEDRGKSA